ncbi:MAG: endonuclease/exonuclease/phosphatase family protein [Polyangiales bacterium]
MRHLAPIAAIALLTACSNPPASELAPPAFSGSVEPDSATLTAPPSARPLKLATWNLEWLSQRSGDGNVKRADADYARLKTYADRLDADVIAFQEVESAEAAARVFDPAKYDFHLARQAIAQRTGFAYRKGLRAMPNADHAALDVGDVRVGADLTVFVRDQPVRLLSVHLKSGCFDGPLDAEANSACGKLARQVPALEGWIDARASEGVAAVVLGDFNRRFFGMPGELVWAELDDAVPPASDLSAPTEGKRSGCWDGEYPEYIDHLVLNLPAAAKLVPGSFAQLVYDASDRAYKEKLSDHCPISIALAGSSDDVTAVAMVDAGAPPVTVDPARDAQTPPTQGLIKGNLSNGRKLYHLPTCPGYASTQIDESAGERWFATEAEAIAAGWTKASNCP